jgi:hypothetical protein
MFLTTSTVLAPLRRASAGRFIALGLLGTSLLAACSDPASIPTTPPTTSAEVTPNISGQLPGVPGSDLSLMGSGQSLASTFTTAAGAFTLTLPSTEKMVTVKKSLASGLLTDLGCTGTLTLGDSAAQGFGFGTLGAGGRSYADLSVSKTLLSRTIAGRAYLYADRPTTLSGPLDCAGATGYPTTVQVSVRAATGWNVLNVNITGSYQFGTGIVVNGSAGNGSLAPGSVWTGVDELKAQIGGF